MLSVVREHTRHLFFVQRAPSARVPDFFLLFFFLAFSHALRHELNPVITSDGAGGGPSWHPARRVLCRCGLCCKNKLRSVISETCGGRESHGAANT